MGLPLFPRPRGRYPGGSRASRSTWPAPLGVGRKAFPRKPRAAVHSPCLRVPDTKMGRIRREPSPRVHAPAAMRVAARSRVAEISHAAIPERARRFARRGVEERVRCRRRRVGTVARIGQEAHAVAVAMAVGEPLRDHRIAKAVATRPAARLRLEIGAHLRVGRPGPERSLVGARAGAFTREDFVGRGVVERFLRSVGSDARRRQARARPDLVRDRARRVRVFPRELAGIRSPWARSIKRVELRRRGSTRGPAFESSRPAASVHHLTLAQQSRRRSRARGRETSARGAGGPFAVADAVVGITRMRLRASSGRARRIGLAARWRSLAPQRPRRAPSRLRSRCA